MYKIAVMGDRDSIYGFAALGLDTYEVKQNSGEAAKILKRLAENDYAIIYMTEPLCSELETELDKYRENLTPAIIPVPAVKGNTGYGQAKVKSFVEKAVGADII
ncbi:MAG: V-type ATP synthase subunit F [Clostridia bacterium]|nr:V-type ATP synthase subunit F [Clostridia bacterium]